MDVPSQGFAMRGVMGFLGALGSPEDASDQIVKRGQKPIEEFLLEILKVTQKPRRTFLLGKTKEGVAMAFRSQMGQHPHAIAVEPRDIDGAHLELAHGLQLADQDLDRSR